MASHAFGAVQDVRADREGEIASVATVLGAHPTVAASTGAYLVAASALLLAPWPGWLAAALPLPYAVNAASFWSVRDADCERANRGWRRFLWLNLVTGFLVTMLLIAVARDCAQRALLPVMRAAMVTPMTARTTWKRSSIQSIPAVSVDATALASAVPSSAAMMPTTIVTRMEMFCLPGANTRPSKPMMAPMTMAETIPRGVIRVPLVVGRRPGPAPDERR